MNRSLIAVLSASVLLTACQKGPEYKTVIAGTVGKTTVTFQTVDGRLIIGDNQVRLRFTDANQQPVDISQPKFELKQASMGGSPGFNVPVELKANGTGQYDAVVSLGSQGNWQGKVVWDDKGPQEWGFASMVL